MSKKVFQDKVLKLNFLLMIFIQFSGYNTLGYAPLAQLVEHLTLNQGVQGSSP